MVSLSELLKGANAIYRCCGLWLFLKGIADPQFQNPFAYSDKMEFRVFLYDGVRTILRLRLMDRAKGLLSIHRAQQAHFKIANVLAEFAENKIADEAPAAETHGRGAGLRGRLDLWRKRAAFSTS